jgi:FAD/FMN-containing dehydrogenase
MRMELGDEVIDVMRDIKKLFDPDNLMNPGKVVPLA